MRPQSPQNRNHEFPKSARRRHARIQSSRQPTVDTLELQLPSKFDVEDMIARLEKSAMKDSVCIDYDAELSNVEIQFDTGVSLRFKDGLCEVTTDKKATPLGLLEAVSKTQGALLTNGSATVPLLNP